MKTQVMLWKKFKAEADQHSLAICPHCETSVREYIARQTQALPETLPSLFVKEPVRQGLKDAEMRVHTLAVMMVADAVQSHSPRLEVTNFEKIHEILCRLWPPFC